MKIPQLRKKLEVKSCHNTSWEDNYSWVHQKNILEVLKDGSKLLPEVRDYLNEENKYTDFQLKDTSEIQKKLFKEILLEYLPADLVPQFKIGFNLLCSSMFHIL